MKLPQFYIDDLIKTALQEDINYIDSTTDLLIPEDDISEAYYMAKDSGVLAGVEIAARVFKLLDENIEVKFLFKDGDRVEKGDILAEFKGNTAAMLKAFKPYPAYERNCHLYKKMRRFGGGNKRFRYRHPQNPPGTSPPAKIFGGGRRRQKPPLQPYRRRHA